MVNSSFFGLKRNPQAASIDYLPLLKGKGSNAGDRPRRHRHRTGHLPIGEMDIMHHHANSTRKSLYTVGGSRRV